MKEIKSRFIISAVNTSDYELVKKHNEIKHKLNLSNEDIVRAGVNHYLQNSVDDLTQNNIS